MFSNAVCHPVPSFYIAVLLERALVQRERDNNLDERRLCIRGMSVHVNYVPISATFHKR